MDIINTISLECNRRLKLNFDGGELSSDAGCLLLREFLSKLGFDKLIFANSKHRFCVLSFPYGQPKPDANDFSDLLWLLYG